MIRRTTFSVTGFIIPMYYTHSPLFRFARGSRARCTYWLNMFSSVFEFAAFDTGFGIAEESWCSYYNSSKLCSVATSTHEMFVKQSTSG